MEIRQSVLLPYSAHDMFDLIETAENYPQFIPWCTKATLLERSDDWVAARLEFSYLKVRFGFQTRNPKRRPEWLELRLVEGPFRNFHGEWRLAPLGDMGCKVSFMIIFEIADGMLDAIARPAANKVAQTMVDAFVKRARATLREVAPGQLPAPAAAQTETPGPPVAPVKETSMIAIETVRGSRLARELTADEAAVLAGVLQIVSVPAQTVLAAEGAADNHLYEVVSGTLGVVKRQGGEDAVQIATLHVGDFAHELGFLDGTARYAALVATADAQVLTLSRESLESLVDAHPRLMFKLMCNIVRTVHGVQTRLAMQASELTNYIVKQNGRY